MSQFFGHPQDYKQNLCVSIRGCGTVHFSFFSYFFGLSSDKFLWVVTLCLLFLALFVSLRPKVQHQDLRVNNSRRSAMHVLNFIAWTNRKEGESDDWLNNGMFQMSLFKSAGKDLISNSGSTKTITKTLLQNQKRTKGKPRLKKESPRPIFEKTSIFF